MVKKILSFFPVHEQYVEPFGGGASVLLAKEPCPHETYNDIDSGLYNFFSMLADPERFESFRRRVALLPYSRELYDDCRATWRDEADPVLRAAKWFVVARQSFGGRFGASLGTTVSSSYRGMAGHNSKWLSAIESLPNVHARLQTVQIEKSDFRKILTRYDGLEYLAYCDPPYVASTRKSGGYAHEMTDRDHRDMIDLLLAYRGSVVLSGYQNSIYSRLEDAGWLRIDFDTVCHTAKTKGAGEALKKQKRIESVWLNPKCQERLEEMKLKKTRKPNQCDAMRCKDSPAHVDADGTKLCARHAPDAPTPTQIVKAEAAPAPSAEIVAEILAPIEDRTAERSEAIDKIEIKSQKMLDLVSELLQKVKADLNTIEGERKRLTKPMLEAKREIDKLFKPRVDALKNLEAKIKASIAGYIESKNKALDDLIEQSAHDLAEPAPELADGIQARTVWKYAIEDERENPREYLIPDHAAIAEHVRVHKEKSNIPGVHAYADTVIAASGAKS